VKGGKKQPFTFEEVFDYEPSYIKKISSDSYHFVGNKAERKNFLLLLEYCKWRKESSGNLNYPSTSQNGSQASHNSSQGGASSTKMLEVLTKPTGPEGADQTSSSRSAQYIKSNSNNISTLHNTLSKPVPAAEGKITKKILFIKDSLDDDEIL
jgi:hypothetical protein